MAARPLTVSEGGPPWPTTSATRSSPERRRPRSPPSPPPFPPRSSPTGSSCRCRRRAEQQRVEARIKELADGLGPRHGMDRRRFLRLQRGHGGRVPRHERGVRPALRRERRPRPRRPGVANQRAGALAKQFIIDVQTHFVRDDFNQAGLARPRQVRQAALEPGAAGARTPLARYKFENYLKEIFVDSDTKVALLSGAPFDDPTWDFLTNDQIAMARASINKISGLAPAARPLRVHAQAGGLDGRGRPLHRHRQARLAGRATPSATRSSPPSSSPYWRLDDDKLMYPFYEKISKAGINTVCIHKGLLPPTTRSRGRGCGSTTRCGTWARRPRTGRRSTSSSITARCGRSWRSPTRRWPSSTRPAASQWATDLAEIPAKYGVKNVYGEVGTVVRQLRGGQPALRRRVRGHADPRARRRSRGLGHRLGVVRLTPVADRGACAGSRSRPTCRRSTASPRSAPPTGRSRPRSSPATRRGSTRST